MKRGRKSKNTPRWASSQHLSAAQRDALPFARRSCWRSPWDLRPHVPHRALLLVWHSIKRGAELGLPACWTEIIRGISEVAQSTWRRMQSSLGVLTGGGSGRTAAIVAHHYIWILSGLGLGSPGVEKECHKGITAAQLSAGCFFYSGMRCWSLVLLALSWRQFAQHTSLLVCLSSYLVVNRRIPFKLVFPLHE